ncbi:ketopantoate reductase-like protein [Marasmius fiardii PR-910]|nr:ketopantoate reductase-like protein [Marasmius fiardii PR-910]
MRFHVLGIGSIGSLVSHHLRRALPSTHTVTLIHKTLRQARDAQDKGGIIRVEASGVVEKASGFKSELFSGMEAGPRRQSRMQEYGQDTVTESELQKEGDKSGQDETNIESLFVTAKAHQTLHALRILLPRLSPNSTIILMQNGMGVYEELVQEIFRNPISRPHFILASNTHGVYSKAPFDVVHAGKGQIRFGIVPDPAGRNFEAGFQDHSIPPPDRRGRLADIVESDDALHFARYRSLRNSVAALVLLDALSATWCSMEEIQIAMRQKLVVNSVINPLTSIMGCRNGDLFQTKAAREVMRSVCYEAAQVFAAQIAANARARGESSGSDEGRLFSVPRLLQAQFLEQECLRVAEATKYNISSMLADIRKGATNTEVNYMNGHLLNLGKQYGVRLPTTLTLWRMVHIRNSIPLDKISHTTRL